MMCDTFTATAHFGGNDNCIFGKNSDREPNEAQQVTLFPARKRKDGKVRATYIELSHSEETFEVILSKPFQMWGAEMGVNEHNVAMGNEAVFTRIPIKRENSGLTGMDILRLALESSRTAEEGRETTCQLIESYGQDACGGYQDKGFYYHNSFIISDPQESFVVESAGRFWAWKRISGYRAISNGLTIEADYDALHPGAADYARKEGWLKDGEPLNFRKAFSATIMPVLAKCSARRSFSEQQGQKARNLFGPSAAMAILQMHAPENEPFRPEKSKMDSLCLHAGGLLTPSQTTGSLVAELRTQGPSTVWLTACAAPCLSLYLPFFKGSAHLEERNFLPPSPFYDGSYWWRHEKLHRTVIMDYGRLAPTLVEERKRLQRKFLQQEKELTGASADQEALLAFSKQCLQEADDLLNEQLEKLGNQKIRPAPFSLYRRYWKKLNKRAKMPAL